MGHRSVSVFILVIQMFKLVILLVGGVHIETTQFLKGCVFTDTVC